MFVVDLRGAFAAGVPPGLDPAVETGSLSSAVTGMEARRPYTHARTHTRAHAHGYTHTRTVTHARCLAP